LRATSAAALTAFAVLFSSWVAVDESMPAKRTVWKRS
jgi:hypothetical protein